MRIINESLTAQELLQKKNYNAIDLSKFVMSICVVYAHISFLGNINPWLNDFISKYFVRPTVPIFFIATSFFLFRKIKDDDAGYDKLKKYAVKFLRLYCLWTLVYIPAIAVDKVIKYPYGGLREGLQYAIGDIFRGASYTHLWFIFSLFIGTAVMILCMRAHLGPITVFCLAVVVYLAGIYFQSYYGLFYGFVFIAMGFIFARKKIILSFGAAFTGFLVSMILGYFEIFVFAVNDIVKSGEMWLSMIPISFFLFYMISHIEMKDRKIYGKLRELSMMVYYLHMLVNFAYRCAVKILEYLLGGRELKNAFVQFISVLAVSLLLSECILRLSRKKKFSWLKLFY